MDDILAVLTKYGPALSALGAVAAFVWTIIQFLSTHSREARSREFDNFHRLVKELVEPSDSERTLKMDRQCAILFELRFFRRYYPVITRILTGLKAHWSTLLKEDDSDLLKEIDMTLRYLNEHKSWWKRFFRFFKPVNY